MKKTLALFLALMLAMAAGAAFAEGTQNAEKPYIAMVAKGFQLAYWQIVKAGAEKAAQDLGVDMHFDGPSSETDIDEQVNKLKDEMAKNPAAIGLAALSTDAVKSELQECLQKKIPVIGFDSGVPDAPEGSIFATVSTDNAKAAALAADKMFENPKFKAALEAATPENPMRIGVLTQDAVSTSTVMRTTGFVDEMTKLCGETKPVSVEGHDRWKKPVDKPAVIIYVQIPATTQAVDVSNAAQAVLNMDNLKAMFLSNEGAVTGFLAATADGSELAPGGRFENLLVVGFDAGSTQKNAIRKGWFAGAITQDPYTIGYKTVELAAKAAKGEKVEDVEVPAKWYDASNMDNDDIKALLYD